MFQVLVVIFSIENEKQSDFASCNGVDQPFLYVPVRKSDFEKEHTMTECLVAIGICFKQPDFLVEKPCRLC